VKSEVLREGNIVSVLEEADIQGDPGGNIVSMLEEADIQGDPGGNIVSVLEEADIQGDPGGNIKYLGSDNIRHCEKENVRMSMCLILNGYRDRAVRFCRTNSVKYSFGGGGGG
jgi:hypothetical protein